jgi:hypothetical protein
VGFEVIIPAFQLAKAFHALNCAATVIGNCDWMPLPHPYYCNKVKGNSLHTATYFLGLVQQNDSVADSGLLYLVFANISDSSSSTCNSAVLNFISTNHYLSLILN